MLQDWHAPCNHLGIGGPDGPDRQVQGMKIMSLRFENAQRLALSFIGALMFTVVMFSAAVSVGPVA